MKRSLALQNLSREHHTALSLAQRARRAAAEGDDAAVAAASAEVLQRYAGDLRPHFDEEENWLMPALAAAGEDALVARTLAEHADLERLASALAEGTDRRPVLAAFAKALSAHVRFEERELFAAAEQYPEQLLRS